MIARQRDHPSHSEIYWALYEPINVKGKPHNSSSEPLLYEEKFRNGMFASQIENKDDDHSALCLERERSSHRNRMAVFVEPQPRLIKGYPARFTCIHLPLYVFRWSGDPCRRSHGSKERIISSFHSLSFM
ncbi:hypothetical protein Aperf_G00000120070 [Anoplocephala perfoliata]